MRAEVVVADQLTGLNGKCYNSFLESMYRANEEGDGVIHQDPPLQP